MDTVCYNLTLRAKRAFAVNLRRQQDKSLPSYLQKMEYMNENNLEHGFDDGKPHNINARLVAKDEDLIIRIRDDCKPFNLTEYYRHIQENTESDKELSLSIIMKMAKDVKYTATFGANNLIVRI